MSRLVKRYRRAHIERALRVAVPVFVLDIDEVLPTLTGGRL